jgi:hypothetical protein
MRYALIIEGCVKNVVEAPDTALFDEFVVVGEPASLTASVGDLWDGASFALPIGTVEEARALRYEQIDRRTGDILAAGFAYAGQTFSLSVEAQTNLHRMDSFKTQLSPVEYPTIDDAAQITLNTPNDIASFVLAGVGTVSAALIGSNQVKKAVRAATTIAAVLAVVDPR